MTRDFHPIEFDPTEHGLSQSKEIYDQLYADLTGSKHNSRFELREFNPDPINGTNSPHNIDIPYISPIDTTDEHRKWIAGLAGPLIMPGRDWEALREGFATIYGLSSTQNHLTSGGIVKIVDSHRTYTGQVIQEIASWTVLNEMGIEAPHEIQTTIVSRVTGLFRLQMLVDLYELEQRAHHDGAIIEDVLLPYGGVLLTLPNSASGNRLVSALTGGLEARRSVVAKTKLAYEQLVNRGGSSGQIFFEGSSGTENEVDAKHGVRIIGEVKERTADLTTEYNQTEGAERIMVVPFFMESEPYTKNPKNPIAPSPTPFAILEPRFPKSKADFDEMMTEMAVAGTIVKASGELPYRYQKYLIGKRRKNTANILFRHTV